MKKSLLTIIIFVLVLVNTVITVLMFLNMSSEVKSANELIAKVCEAIELDVAASESNESSVPVEQMDNQEVVPENMTVNLKKGDDGEAHYAVLTCSVTLNKSSKTYETYGATFADYAKKVQSIIQQKVSSYTFDQITEDQQAVRDDIKDAINQLFGGNDFCISVDFPTINYQ